MTPEERKAKIRWMDVEVYSKRNWDALDEVYAPDYVRHMPPLPTLVGVAAYKEYLLDWMSNYSPLQLTEDGMISEGDIGVTWWTFRGVNQAGSGTNGTGTAGKAVAWTGCTVARWVGDKIVDEWVWVDYLGLVQQLAG